MVDCFYEILDAYTLARWTLQREYDEGRGQRNSRDRFHDAETYTSGPFVAASSMGP